MNVIDNIVYAADKSTGRQIDVVSMTVNKGTVEELTAFDGAQYSGTDVQLFTDKDFLYVPDLDQCLCDGDQIYLDNQSTQRWVIRRGWYSVDDNPPIWGWYLESIPAGKIRSLFLKDFNSLTLVTPRTYFQLPTQISRTEVDCK